jgi:hypothetical protein
VAPNAATLTLANVCSMKPLIDHEKDHKNLDGPKKLDDTKKLMKAMTPLTNMSQANIK